MLVQNGNDAFLRVGILGAGTIAGVHARNLDQIPEARLMAVADVDTRRAADLAEPRGAAVVADLDQLLQQPLDAVLVCLPPFATRGIVTRIAEAGMHVYAEKPVALDLTNARSDLAAVRQAGIVAASGYMWRASPIVSRARELLTDRKLGLIQGTVITGPPPPVWWRDKSLSGGAIVELGTHVVDLMRLFGGEPRRVTCVGSRSLLQDERCSVEDVVAATVQFESGAVGSYTLTCGTTGGRWSLDLVAHNLHLNLNFFPEHLTGNSNGERVEYEADALPAIVPHGFSGASSWYLSLRQFVRAALKRNVDGVGSSFENGVRTLALTLAFEQSLQSGGIPVAVERIL